MKAATNVCSELRVMAGPRLGEEKTLTGQEGLKHWGDPDVSNALAPAWTWYRSKPVNAIPNNSSLIMNPTWNWLLLGIAAKPGTGDVFTEVTWKRKPHRGAGQSEGTLCRVSPGTVETNVKHGIYETFSACRPHPKHTPDADLHTSHHKWETHTEWCSHAHVHRHTHTHTHTVTGIFSRLRLAFNQPVHLQFIGGSSLSLPPSICVFIYYPAQRNPPIHGRTLPSSGEDWRRRNKKKVPMNPSAFSANLI